MTKKIVGARTPNAKRDEQRAARLKGRLLELLQLVEHKLGPFHKNSRATLDDALVRRAALLDYLITLLVLRFDNEGQEQRMIAAINMVGPDNRDCWWTDADDPHVSVHHALGLLRRHVEYSASSSRGALAKMLERYEAEVLVELQAKRSVDRMLAEMKDMKAEVIDFAEERARRVQR